jgi:hypothetical protein
MTSKILASFIFHNQHIITLKRTEDGHSVQCDTCAIPAVVSAGVKFMHGHNVHSMMIDGAPLSKI